MVLYNKLYNIDKYGHKKHLKKLKPIFQYRQNTMGGNKKHEIIRVAQENLYMLKRLNERTSFYNVEKWNKDYEISQYYKRNHCLYAPIDFNKTQRLGGYSNNFKYAGVQTHNNFTTRKKFFSKTHYSGKIMEDLPDIKRLTNSTRKRKRFEDFNYRDLQMDDKKKDEEEKVFKKISDMENIEQEQKNEKEEKNENDNNNNENNNDEEKKEENNEEKKEENSDEKKEENREENNEEKKEENNEEKEKSDKDVENEGQREQKNNNRDDKEEKKENDENKIQTNKEEQ